MSLITGDICQVLSSLPEIPFADLRGETGSSVPSPWPQKAARLMMHPYSFSKHIFLNLWFLRVRLLYAHEKDLGENLSSERSFRGFLFFFFLESLEVILECPIYCVMVSHLIIAFTLVLMWLQMARRSTKQIQCLTVTSAPASGPFIPCGRWSCGNQQIWLGTIRNSCGFSLGLPSDDREMDCLS